MLDVRTGKLLEKLNHLCKNTAFCLVEEEDLLSAGEDGESIRGMLGFLKDRGYLEMQYADGGEYCVRILPEGRLYSERERAERQDEKRRSKKSALCAFLGALLGAFLGGGAVCLLALLVLRYV